MKTPLLIILLFFQLFAISQKVEIDKQVYIIDSLKEHNSLIKKVYQDMSFCGGSLEGFYLDSSLVLINSIYSAESGHISEDVYFVNNKAIKITYHKHAAEWKKHDENFPIEAGEGDYKNMTFTDTTYQIYLTETPTMIKYSKYKLIDRKLNSDLLNKLINCYKRMTYELNGDRVTAVKVIREKN